MIDISLKLNITDNSGFLTLAFTINVINVNLGPN